MSHKCRPFALFVVRESLRRLPWMRARCGRSSIAERVSKTDPGDEICNSGHHQVLSPTPRSSCFTSLSERLSPLLVARWLGDQINAQLNKY